MVCHTEDHIETMNTESSVLYYDKNAWLGYSSKMHLVEVCIFCES